MAFRETTVCHHLKMSNPFFQLLHWSCRNELISGMASSNSVMSKSTWKHRSAFLSTPFPKVTNVSSTTSHFLSMTFCNQHKTQQVPALTVWLNKRVKKSHSCCSLHFSNLHYLPSKCLIIMERNRFKFLWHLPLNICEVHLRAEDLS